MKNVRKTVSLLLAVVLLIGILPVSTSAATAITEEAILNFTTPVAGQTSPEATTVTVPNGAHYHIDQAGWFDETEGRGMKAGEIFVKDKMYSFAVFLEADSGYEFSVYSSITINGSSSLIDFDYTGITDDGLLQIWTVPMYASDALNMVNVKVTTWPAEGHKVSDLPAPYLASDALYTISQWNWYDEDHHFGLESSDTFEGGVHYSLLVHLIPKSGYKFGSSVTFTINGKSDKVDQSRSSVRAQNLAELRSVTVVAERSVGVITVNGYEKPVIGQRVSDMPSFSVPGGVPYSLVSAGWYNSSDAAMSGSDTFVSGQSYYVAGVVQLDDGYSFSADGIEIEIGAKIDFSRSIMVNNTLYFYTTAVTPAAGLINDIRITLPEPQIGQTPADLPDPAIPSGVNYSIASFSWAREYSDTERIVLKSTDRFHANVQYSCNVMIQPQNGYAFSANVTVYINGSPNLVDTEHSGEKSGNYSVWSISHTLTGGSEEGLISEVRLEGFKVPRVGQTVKDNFAGVNIPGDAPYSVQTIGWACGETPLATTDAFEEGKSYYMVCRIAPEEGYYFDPAALPTVFFNDSSDYVPEGNMAVADNGTLVFISSNFTPLTASQVQIITEVRLEEFTEPVIGQTVADNLKNMNTSTDMYNVQYYWVRNYTEQMSSSEIFEEGNTYFLYIYVIPKDAYGFDGDSLPTVLINGSGEYVDDEYVTLGANGVLTVFSVDFYPKATPEIKYGDVNGDGKINGQDLIRLRKYLNGENVEIGPGANVNGDAGGVINGLDLIRLRKYLNGEAVVLGPAN